jgi:hypothetical protein
VIPPFSFVGELEIGNSGFWYPTSTMELTRCSLTASGAGTSTATLTVNKQEPGIPDPLVLTTMTLGADGLDKKVYTLNETLVTPYDKIYITSYADSGHTGVVVQLIGVMMT